MYSLLEVLVLSLIMISRMVMIVVGILLIQGLVYQLSFKKVNLFKIVLNFIDKICK